jgi:hypothetical protein
MQTNEHQNRLLCDMINVIEDFRRGEIQYSNVVGGLEGSLYAGEFQNEDFVRQWYDYWTPLEILNATKGDSTTIEDIGEDLSAMEMFLKCQLDSCS